jgi:hypothetical protein
MGTPAGFDNGLVAHRDEFLVKRARRDVPEALPIHADVSVPREAVTCVLCVL